MIVKGDIIYTPDPSTFQVIENGYLFIEDGRIAGVAQDYHGQEEVLDRSGSLILPPFVDLHLHANQFANCGLGYGEELLGWLKKYTYPEEVRFKDLGYAETIYKLVLNQLWAGGSLRSVVYASLYEEATDLYIRLAQEAGLGAYVGKANMDRNSAPFYIETTEESIRGTENLISRYGDGDLVRTIITPRFVPHCTTESMEGQGKLAKETGTPVQSHINESLAEIRWVKELYPDAPHYSGVYDSFGLFGEHGKAIMAHCIYNEPAELELMKKRGIYPVHCPESNANLTSGIMDVKGMLAAGLPVSLGSDISGGQHLYMPYQIVLAIQLSKMKARMEGDLSKALEFSEVFYMATKSGGSFFGSVGSLEEGYEGDFLVVDTSSLLVPGEERSPLERLEKFIYIGSSEQIKERYIRGKALEKPFR